LTGLSDVVRVLPGRLSAGGPPGRDLATRPVQCAPDHLGEVWPACAPGVGWGTAARGPVWPTWGGRPNGSGGCHRIAQRVSMAHLK